MNLDPNLQTDDWKKQCDLAKKKVDEIVTKINNL